MSGPATAADVLAVFRGEIDSGEADAILASYFAPGPQPRFDVPQDQDQAQEVAR
jgi:hypothetical protein